MRALWVAVIATVVGVGLGWGAANVLGQPQTAKVAAMRLEQAQQQAQQLSEQLTALQARYEALDGQLLVEESTRKSLESSLHAVQVQLHEAHERLAFFDQLLPAGPKGAVAIRGFDIVPLGPNLQYKAVFTRQSANNTPFKGHMQFLAEGQRNGENVTEVLSSVIADSPQGVSDTQAPAEQQTQEDSFELLFDQFQRAEGVLAVPDDFSLQAVTLNVLEGNTVKASRRIVFDSATP